jgi:hypothetical protein
MESFSPRRELGRTDFIASVLGAGALADRSPSYLIPINYREITSMMA